MATSHDGEFIRQLLKTLFVFFIMWPQQFSGVANYLKTQASSEQSSWLKTTQQHDRINSLWIKSNPVRFNRGMENNYMSTTNNCSAPCGATTASDVLSLNKQNLDQVNSSSNYATVTMGTFFTPIYKILYPCEARVVKFGESTSNFISCSISYSRPLEFCRQCVQPYLEMEKNYNDIIKEPLENDTDKTCSDVMLHGDRVQITEAIYELMVELWRSSNCFDCFHCKDKNGTTDCQPTEEVRKFTALYKQLQQCINSSAFGQPFEVDLSPKNRTAICANCGVFYVNLSDHFNSLHSGEMEKVCMDLVDAMNYTRRQWTDEFHCRETFGNVVHVLTASGIVASLPVVFYVGIAFRMKNKEHKILKQKRLPKTMRGSRLSRLGIRFPSIRSG